MGFWKVLGGVAAGVGVVVAAPVFGAVGTITAAGVAVGAAAGALGGAVASSVEEDERTEARNEGYREGRAENFVEIQKLQERLALAEARFTEHKQYENLLVAMFAVGISVANSDGTICGDEKDAINGFILGESFVGLPTTIKTVIQELHENPPTFNTTMEYVKRVDREDWAIFDSVILLIIESDSYTHSEELAYQQAWEQFKAS